MRLESTCKQCKGLGLFASLFASQLSFQLSTLSSLRLTHLILTIQHRSYWLAFYPKSFAFSAINNCELYLVYIYSPFSFNVFKKFTS